MKFSNELVLVNSSSLFRIKKKLVYDKFQLRLSIKGGPLARVSYEQLEKSLDKAINSYVKVGLMRLIANSLAGAAARSEGELLQTQHQQQSALLTLLNQHPARMRAQFRSWGIAIEEVRFLAEQAELFTPKQREIFDKIVNLLRALQSSQAPSGKSEQNSSLIKQQRQSATDIKYVKQRKNWHPL